MEQTNTFIKYDYWLFADSKALENLTVTQLIEKISAFMQKKLRKIRHWPMVLRNCRSVPMDFALEFLY